MTTSVTRLHLLIAAALAAAGLGFFWLLDAAYRLGYREGRDEGYHDGQIEACGA